MIGILTDSEGALLWGIRVEDVGIEDPPVVCDDVNSEPSFPVISKFVAAMIADDVMIGTDNKSKVEMELNDETARTGLGCLVSSRCGDLIADGPFESATVMIFAYPGKRHAFGISRTPAGQALLERLQVKREDAPKNKPWWKFWE
jgi:hypothetical protein